MPTDSHASGDSFDVYEYAAVLGRQKWLVIGLAAVTLIAALVWSFTRPAVYTSTTSVLVKPTALNPAGSIPLASTINMSTEEQVVRSQAVAALAAKSAGIASTDVSAHVSATFPLDSQVLMISYSASTAEDAQAGAAAVADGYLAYRKQQAISDAADAVAAANLQIKALQSQADAAAKQAASLKPGSSEQAAAANQVAQLNGRIAIWQNSASVINLQAINPGTVLVPANLPSSPSSPNHRKDAVAGLILGLILGIAAALLRDGARRHRADQLVPAASG
jgi:capsular polysaccharide biosynthesis protein